MEQTNSPEQPNQNKQNSQNNLMAILAYILFFIPLLTDAKNDVFVRYHVRQGLGLFILAIIVGAINSFMPFFFGFMEVILNLGVLVLLVIGIKNVLGGKKEPLPLIGKMAEKINI